MAEIDDAYMEALVAERANLAEMYDHLREDLAAMRAEIAATREYAREARDESKATNGRMDEVEKHQSRLLDDWYGPESERFKRGKPSYKEKVDEVYGAHRDRLATRALLGFIGVGVLLMLIREAVEFFAVLAG